MKLKSKLRFAFCLGLALILGCVSTAFAAEETTTVQITPTYGQTEARSMLDLINAFRTGDDAWCWNSSSTEKVYYTNLQPLTYDFGLEQAAMQRAAEIAMSFSHTRPDGTLCFTALTEISKNLGSYGENIAAGQTSAAYAFASWQESNATYSGQGHRRSMLSDSFRYIGIGHVTVNGTQYWVQEFSVNPTGVSDSGAVDTAKETAVNVASSQISSAKVTAAQSGLTVNVADRADLPTLTGSLLLNSAWPSKAVSVSLTPTWTCDSEILTLSDTGITANGRGTANLTATALGTTVTLPVTVTCKGTLGDNLSWEISGDTLTVSGSGAMEEHDNQADYPWAPYMDGVTKIVIEDGVTTIGKAAFRSYDQLELVTLPDSITVIGELALAYNENMQLASTTLPASLVTIGDYAFEYDWSLTGDLVFPEGLTSIGISCFWGSAITGVSLPSTLKDVADYCFEYCKKLTKITLAEGITTISNAMFLWNSASSIVLPSTITSVGDFALVGTDQIYFTGDAPELGVCFAAGESDVDTSTRDAYYPQNNSTWTDELMNSATRVSWHSYDVCAMVGHRWGNYVTGKEPTLTSAGYRQRSCALCAEVETEELEKLSLTTVSFTDVKVTQWYAPYVEEAYQLGLVNGMGNGLFSPLSTTNRAMVVRILYNMADQPAILGRTNPFVDVAENQWYFNAIEWAYLNKVTNGTSDTTFSPLSNVTREQIAVFLYAYSGKPASSGDLSAFSDAGKVHSWGQAAMAWAVENGIINGVGQSDGTSLLSPSASATRAQVATMFVRYAELMG